GCACCVAGGEPGHLQLPRRIAPGDAGDRQVAVFERLLDLARGGPAGHLVRDLDERLEGSAAGELERAVLGHEATVAGAIDADDRPVWLLCREPARKAAARHPPGERGDKGV